MPQKPLKNAVVTHSLQSMYGMVYDHTTAVTEKLHPSENSSPLGGRRIEKRHARGDDFE